MKLTPFKIYLTFLLVGYTLLIWKLFFPQPGMRIISNDMYRCEQAHGELRVYYSDYEDGYNVSCEVPEQTLFEYTGNPI